MNNFEKIDDYIIMNENLGNGPYGKMYKAFANDNP